MTQLDYIRLDTDFFDKPKIKALLYKFGHEGLIFFIKILCQVGRSTDCKLNEEQCAALAFESQMPTEKTEEFFSYCLERGLLDGTRTELSNSRVRDDVAALEHKRSKARQRQQRYRAVSEEERGEQQEKHRETPIVPSVAGPKIELQPVDVAKEDQSSFDTSDPHLQTALTKLETPEGQDWTLDSRFVNASRRPLKKFPLIWLTPHELADILKRLEQSQIPKNKYKDLFLKAEARLKTQKTVGRNGVFVSAYNWLAGFLMDEVIEQTIKEKRLEKAIQWTKN